MSAVMSEWMHRHRISVDEYYRMAEAGILSPDARVELIEGEIIDMSPVGALHCGTVNQLYAILTRAIGDRAGIRSQLAVRLSDRSEPQPDIHVVKARRISTRKNTRSRTIRC